LIADNLTVSYLHLICNDIWAVWAMAKSKHPSLYLYRFDMFGIFALSSVSILVNIFNILTEFILIRLLHTSLGADFVGVVYY
jgi:hypothetical protein